jgi:hypothetical protein
MFWYCLHLQQSSLTELAITAHGPCTFRVLHGTSLQPLYLSPAFSKTSEWQPSSQEKFFPKKNYFPVINHLTHFNCRAVPGKFLCKADPWSFGTRLAIHVVHYPQHFMKGKNMRNLPLFLILVWLAITSAGNAHAGCPKALEEEPTIQIGATATKSDMLILQKQVEAYIKRGEQTLRCTGSSMRYNMMLNKIERVAELYNKKLGQFNSRLATL